MRTHVHEQLKVARRPTHSGLTFSTDSQSLAVGDAFRNLHFRCPAIRRAQFHRRALDRITEVDRRFGFDVAAAVRLRLEAAPTAAAPSTKQIAEQVREVDRSTAATRASTRTTPARAAGVHEIREVESGERILSAGSESLASEAVVLLAFRLIAEHRVRFGNLFEFVFGVLVAF